MSRPVDITPDTPPPVALGRTRSRVLELLQSDAQAQTVAAVAGALDLHANTARFHLDALVDAGLAQRRSEDTHRPGRPRTLYTAHPDSPAVGQRSYRMLAEILAGHLAATSDDPANEAVRAGREWGRSLATRPGPFQRVGAAEALHQLTDVLTDVGFRPHTGVGGRSVELHHCPFRELAVAQGTVAVVCSIHLGVMQGLLDELDAPVQALEARPFVEPALCVVDLGPRRRRR